jgi:hypothetical protein
MAKANCKQIFPIAEELKSKLLAKYEVEYNLWISHKVLMSVRFDLNLK